MMAVYEVDKHGVTDFSSPSAQTDSLVQWISEFFQRGYRSQAVKAGMYKFRAPGRRDIILYKGACYLWVFNMQLASCHPYGS
jgi:hypothetical protein